MHDLRGKGRNQVRFGDPRKRKLSSQARIRAGTLPVHRHQLLVRLQAWWIRQQEARLTTLRATPHVRWRADELLLFRWKRSMNFRFLDMTRVPLGEGVHLSSFALT